MAEQARQPGATVQAGTLAAEGSGKPPASELPRAAVPAASLPTVQPAPRSSRTIVWLLLLLVLAPVAAPLLLLLNRPDPQDPQEVTALIISTQTWRHHAGLSAEAPFAVESLIPYHDGSVRTYVPPATTWFHQAMLRWLDPQRASFEEVVMAARLVSVLCALIAVAAVYWAGISLGGVRGAVLSALIFAACPLLIYQGRIASAVMPTVALTLTSIAAALWALRPLRPSPVVARQIIGWILCGICTGLAVLTSGPSSILVVALSILVMLLLCPHRISHILGLLAALLLATLIVLPWIAVTHSHAPETWRLWVQDWLDDVYLLDADPSIIGPILSARALRLLIALVPWPLWAIAAMLQPFSASSSGERTAMFIPWAWFMICVCLLFCAPRTDVRMLMLFTAGSAALLIGFVFQQYASRASEGRFPKLWRLVRWPHLFAVTWFSLAVPAVMLYQGALAAHNLPDYFANPGWLYSIGLACILVSMAALSLRWALRDHPAKAMMTWTLWAMILVLAVVIPLARGTVATHPLRAEGQLLAGSVRNQKLFMLQPAVPSAHEPTIGLLLFAQREVLPLTWTQLDDAIRDHTHFYLLTTDALPQALLNAPRTQCTQIRRFDHAALVLYHCHRRNPMTTPSASAPGAPAPVHTGAPDSVEH